ncbi:hypothetical protein J3A83DRAFT_4369553 [Scleroderma citrinum]
MIEVAIEGDFEQLVQDIRLKNNITTAGMLQCEWDFRVPDEEAFRDDLHEAAGIGKRRRRKVRALIGEGNQAYVDNNLAKAIQIMQEVIRIEPHAVSAWSVLAQCYEDQHKPKVLQLQIMAAHLGHDVEWEYLA